MQFNQNKQTNMVKKNSPGFLECWRFLEFLEICQTNYYWTYIMCKLVVLLSTKNFLDEKVDKGLGQLNWAWKALDEKSFNDRSPPLTQSYFILLGHVKLTNTTPRACIFLASIFSVLGLLDKLKGNIFGKDWKCKEKPRINGKKKKKMYDNLKICMFNVKLWETFFVS